MNPTVLEALQGCNDQAELWWDSLPTRYAPWQERLLAMAPGGRQAGLQHQVERFWDPQDPMAGLVRGCTTNPRLVHDGLMQDPEAWADALRMLSRAYPAADEETLYWHLYQEVFRRNARLLWPLWQRTEGRHGWICAQLLPDVSWDAAAMIAQGADLAAVGPNLMIKVVGSEEGFQAIEELTSRGISTNCTLSFSVAQGTRWLSAIRAGRARARREGVDLSRWRAVFTCMMGRIGAEEAFRQQAEATGIRLGPMDVRWAEVAIASRLQRMIQREDSRLKLLLCSLKFDPWRRPAGCLHLEQSAGMDCVYTLSPAFLQEVWGQDGWRPAFDGGAGGTVPAPVLDRLRRVPYFQQAYDPEGLRPEEFALQPAFRRGLREVTVACGETLAWVRSALAQQEMVRD